MQTESEPFFLFCNNERRTNSFEKNDDSKMLLAVDGQKRLVLRKYEQAKILGENEEDCYQS